MRIDAREGNPPAHKDVASESGNDIAEVCLDCGCEIPPLIQASSLLMGNVGKRQNRKAVTELRSF